MGPHEQRKLEEFKKEIEDLKSYKKSGHVEQHHIQRLFDEVKSLRQKIQNLERMVFEQRTENISTEVREQHGRIKRLESIIEGREHNEKVEYDHIVDVNKKVAVYAPEAWMKEKVANVWNAELLHDSILDYPNCDYVFLTEGKLDYAELRQVNVFDLQEISFQDFCKQHGWIPKPAYVWFDSKIVPTFIENGELQVVVPNTNGGQAIVENNRAATEKEYMEQEVKKNDMPDSTYDKDFFDKIPNEEAIKEYVQQQSEKEPELKLNEEWQNHPQYMYAEGAKDMQKAIYELIYDLHEEGYNGMAFKLELQARMRTGKIKPPKQ